MDKIDAMKAFVAVASEGSFTKAADRLDLSNQLVSKYVAQLEAYLGVRLFNRTTRQVRLTEAGEHCLAHVEQILESIQDMERHVGQIHSDAQGVLHVSAPVSFATQHLAPMLSTFHHQHPAVSVNLQLNDRKIDVVEEGFDVVLRIGRLKDSSLIAKTITRIRLILCASPDYIHSQSWQAASLYSPSQLNPADYLRYSYMNHANVSQQDNPLMQALKHTAKSSPMVCNNGDILTQLAIQGQGYILQPSFMVAQALRQGKLVQLLPDYEPEPLGLYALYPHRKLLATKLRVFLDCLADFFGDPPYWDIDTFMK